MVILCIGFTVVLVFLKVKVRQLEEKLNRLSQIVYGTDFEGRE